MLNPSLYQINTRIFLNELGQSLGRRATLDDWPTRHLDELRELGFDWVWLLGIWQTGPAGRQVSRTVPEWQAGFRQALPDLTGADICGSPFAIRGYSVHEDYGGDEALARFRDQLGRRGLLLMLDFVPNHVALDHPWVNSDPEFFIPGSPDDLARQPGNFCTVQCSRGALILAHGRDPYFPGWPDTLQLNYRYPGLRAAMIAELLRIAERCDGVRCDMAMLVLPDIFLKTWGSSSRPADGSTPVDTPFWPEALARVHRYSPAFLFLAEVYWDLEWRLQRQGFQYTYDKRLYDRLREQHTGAIREHLAADLDFQGKLVRFLESHDEPRAAGVFAPAVHQAAALIAYLTPGLRFFHEGQLEGRRAHASLHLGRRPAEVPDQALQAFYRRFLECLQRAELRQGIWKLWPGRPAWDGNPTWQNIIAFTWESGSLPLLVCVNYGPRRGQCWLPLPLASLRGRKVQLIDLLSSARYLRDGDELAGRGLYLDLPEWGYNLFAVQDESNSR